jgi:hypothetical protein
MTQRIRDAACRQLCKVPFLARLPIAMGAVIVPLVAAIHILGGDPWPWWIYVLWIGICVVVCLRFTEWWEELDKDKRKPDA